jgi:hypothetical protein
MLVKDWRQSKNSNRASHRSMNYPECMRSGRDYARNDEHLRRNDVGVCLDRV